MPEDNNNNNANNNTGGLCVRCGKRPAVVYVSRIDGDNQKQEGYCLKCAYELNIGPIRNMMEKMGITEDDIDDVSDQIEDVMGSLSGQDGFQIGGAQPFPFMSGLFNQNNGNNQNNSDKNKSNNNSSNNSSEKVHRREKRNKDKENKSERRFINQYCTDLTKQARDGKLDKIIGRDDEIYRVTEILCRRTKNNPCLIGEPGVGKTAIAEGLAQRIAEGSVPAKLQNKEIQLLDLTALVAGTQFRGQFESRIKGLIEEVKKEGNIILFIDEVHNLVGAGDSEGSMNAANILKPALSRGEIQVIGATTFNEYRKYIEKDAALERRFQPVKIEEPSINDTYKMLQGIKSYYEDFHRVKISDSLLYKTVTLSERYITDRFLPDKAIDLLDEACTCANLRNKAISDCEAAENKYADLIAQEQDMMNTDEGEEPDYEALAEVRSQKMAIEQKLPELREKASDNAVTEDDIAKVINLWTGVPTSKIIDSDLDKLADMESHLKAKIIGQDEAIEAVCAAIRRNRIQINPQKRPSSFIFVGPTGVGKTELVKQLANELFDSPETLIRLDMSEFMEKFSVSRIIGSPPGYVGYDEAGQLTEKVRRKPYSVILFDEIEKAHPDVMNILLQILDEGKTSDAQGRVVDFSNTVIIMTSNAGSTIDNAMGFGRSEQDVSKEKALKGLRQFLRPEFIGRVDDVVVFNQLTKENYKDIAKLQINELKTNLEDKAITLDVDDDVSELIASTAADGVRGARDIRIAVRKELEDPIANIIIETRHDGVSRIKAFVKDNKIVCEKEI